MLLGAHLNRLQILRLPEFPHSLRHICLIMFTRQLPMVEAIMSSRPGSRLECIALMDMDNPDPKMHSFRQRNVELQVPLVNAIKLINMPHLEKVFCVEPADPHCVVFTSLSRILANHGVRHFYMHLEAPLRPVGPYPYSPEFYNENAENLEKIYILLDEDGRETYAARIKAIITGNPGYLPISPHQEYYHPLIKPEQGDIMIDGGVSDAVEMQKNFAQSVGCNGMIFGFEPIPQMCASARKTLSKYPQYKIFCAGLGEHKGKLHFMDRRDSSHVAEPGEGTMECDVINIDSFVKANKIGRLNCIKLDVEGSELAALKGAENTIKKLHPKLIVCLYHKNEDLLEIPAYIKSIVPEYKLYLAHSSTHFIDTVLYAKVPD